MIIYGFYLMFLYHKSFVGGERGRKSSVLGVLFPAGSHSLPLSVELNTSLAVEV